MLRSVSHVSVLIVLFAVCGLPWAPAAARAAGSDELVSLSGETMGTTWHVKVTSPADGPDSDTLLAGIGETLERVNDQMSTWREDSELSRFNRHETDTWFEVSAETATVVAAALELSERTGGAFDPTVGPLVRLWNFGPNPGEREIPDEETIATARQRVGYEQIEVRLVPPALRKSQPSVELDLSAIAKGFGVDEVAAWVKQAGASGAMVEIGGEVRTFGTKPDGTDWKIGIEQPTVGRRAVGRVVALKGKSLATSGDYRNFFVADGERFSHTIDPRTGRPVTHELASVSVVSDDCMRADGWATALMVLGPEAGMALAEEQGLAASFLIRSEDAFRTESTAAFAAMFGEPEPAGGASLMGTFLVTAAIFALAICGLAVGVIFSNRRLRGSCGGMDGLKDEKGNPICQACTRPREECTEFREAVAGSAQAGTGQHDADSAQPQC
ncbi:Thiamine biosynthesis lipoprotein ApbE precursor [Maioricimonas rarisocia]|uniref:FAD:protein FMN transferase n=1 Tax=Maioricimonas rarisocia TaxID=2528026 RepID=A0A517ZD30_9PLAN|nr:FAD:protein FMN transferase [Maioricimonas rarisocia]QDU40403.1 Thiamine biosynthesis lipoprotein ApbE precursor [Maioricimonas rarisocia]